MTLPEFATSSDANDEEANSGYTTNWLVGGERIALTFPTHGSHRQAADSPARHTDARYGTGHIQEVHS